ncbi:MAG: type 4a pilus biogenesis protein PilO [Gammaproteobacteria bacterium]
MIRQYRQVNFWIYRLVLMAVLISGVVFDIKPLVIELMKIRSTHEHAYAQLKNENELIQRRVMLQSNVDKIMLRLEKYYRSNSASDLMMELLTKIWQASTTNGLMIQSMEPLPWKTTVAIDTLEVHIIALGKFSQFVNFFTVLAESSLPLILNDFSLQLEASGLMRMEMKLSALYMASNQKSVALVSPMLKQKRDPFVEDRGAILTDRIEDLGSLLHSVSWRQLHVVGYLHEDPVYWGLVMLPNGRTVAIDKNTRIGLEKASVVAINESGITIEIAGNNQKMD